MKRLADICDIQYGYAFDSKCFTEDSSYPQLVRIRDVKRGYSETYYSGNYPDEYILSEGDLLIGMDGEFNIARWKCSGALLNQRVCKLTTKVGTNEEYLRFAMLKSLKEIEQRTAFVTVKHLSAKELNKLELDVPELTKQDKIADTLSRLERVIEARKEELEKLDELIKARFVEMFGDPRSNPFGFSKSVLKDTCKVVTGNTPSRAVQEYYGNYVEWIKTDNIVSEMINPTKATESLSEEGMKVGRTVDKDSILMACIAGSIASIGKVCVTDRTVAFNQQINAIVPEEYNILFLYVLLQLSKDYLVEDINMALKGILSKSKLEEKEFIVPPMELQKQFADFVKQVDKSKVKVQKALDETQKLFDSLMQQYFG
ncbi:restriction endonuclease subunit S [Blautia massiliensis]|uniref:restriction endonuclease subunit S n=1 Tax=Blautia TaxID=572511 RepID=UPI00156E646D|nr:MULTISPECIES: restriction endonuclease subunit S [Blautia]MCC2724722.1 restriction endonuclease subunit S [Blautia sp. MSK22_86]NSF55958.1 restriction endonuclease subunit S [Blautia massiliensis (ex Durand et al. 2017)]